jgi:predicted metal-dependent HD superfamily phosphohydrolase
MSELSPPAMTLAPPVPPYGLVLPAPLWDAVQAAYGSPGRAYHDLTHVREVLRRFDEVAAAVGWAQPQEVFLALLFHDAVYVVGDGENEANSAALAMTAIARWLPNAKLDAERVAQLIRLTARHGALRAGELDDDAALFVDCDMAILGSRPDAFDAYDRAIREEYAVVPPEIFRAGRRHFFERLLASERIFLSRYFLAELEAAARANLQRALSA